MNNFNEMIKIADIHAENIQTAHENLSQIFPVDTKKVEQFKHEEILMSDFLIYRFSKLQDYIGKVLIDALLKKTGDYLENMTMIDKLNKLEKLQIINSVSTWEEMRRTRNHIAHEYPDKPELTAKYLNQIYNLAPELLNILDNIKNYVAKIR